MNMPVIMNSKPRVLVTRRWPAAVEAQLAERFDTQFNRTDTPLTSAEFRSALARFDAILPTVTDKLGAEALDVTAPQTRLLANYGVGYSHIDSDAVRAHGITVSNMSGVMIPPAHAAPLQCRNGVSAVPTWPRHGPYKVHEWFVHGSYMV